MTVHPLAHWPQQLTEAQTNAIRAAKAQIQTEVKVLLTPATPGCPTRVLSLAGRPPFVCDVAIVRPHGDVKAAMEWILFDGPVERGYSVASYLSDLLGAIETTTASDQFVFEEELRQARFGNG